MALHSFINEATQSSKDNVSDFFIFGSVASAISVGFVGLAEEPLRIFAAGMFAAVAMAFYAASFVCWIQYRRFRREAIERRVFSVAASAGAAPAGGVSGAKYAPPADVISISSRREPS